VSRKDQPRAESSAATVPLLDRLLMAVFWMLLGGAAGIKVMQSLWRFLGFDVGEVTIAVPVGGVLGAAVGVLLGMITNPRVLVLMMAVFAGSAAGGVAGRLAWGDIGEIGGQAAGALWVGSLGLPGCFLAKAK
jgi:hypothetical protein